MSLNQIRQAERKAASKPAPPRRQKVVQEELTELELLAKAADDEGDYKAFKKLTKLAKAKDLDVDDYETWADVAKALQ